jgi:hypothetical protein
VKRQVVRELIETKTPLAWPTLPSEGLDWQVHYAFFARSGFTPRAIDQLQKVCGMALDLPDLDAVLGHQGGSVLLKKPLKTRFAKAAPVFGSCGQMDGG